MKIYFPKGLSPYKNSNLFALAYRVALDTYDIIALYENFGDCQQQTLLGDDLYTIDLNTYEVIL